jgi:hypothetical protein
MLMKVVNYTRHSSGSGGNLGARGPSFSSRTALAVLNCLVFLVPAVAEIDHADSAIVAVECRINAPAAASGDMWIDGRISYSDSASVAVECRVNAPAIADVDVWVDGRISRPYTAENSVAVPLDALVNAPVSADSNDIPFAITPVNRDWADSGALTVDYPVPEPGPDLAAVIAAPSRVGIGEPITVTVTGGNTGGAGGPDSALNASVLYANGSANLTVAGPTDVSWADTTFNYGPGEGTIFDTQGDPIGPAIHHLVEAVDDEWRIGEDHAMTFTVTPYEAGIIYIRARVTLRHGEDGPFINDASAGGPLAVDQNGWLVSQHAVTVESDDGVGMVGVRGRQIRGTHEVEILFNLATGDAKPVELQLELSSDGGANFDIVPLTAFGALGPKVRPGAGQRIVWHAGTDWPGGFTNQMVARLVVVHPDGRITSFESDAFVVDTQRPVVSSLTGNLVADYPGGAPVEGAAIVLQPGGLAAESEADGSFVLDDVALGTGYLLEIIADGFEPYALDSVDIGAGANSLGEIVLTPLTGDFEIVPLEPDINPGVSEVEEGGFAYRYYRILSVSDEQPHGGKAVEVHLGNVPGTVIPQAGYSPRPGYAGVQSGVSDSKTGIVRVCIPASAVGVAGTEATITVVLPDETAGPTFLVRVTARSFDHYWSQGTAGGGHLRLNAGGGVRVGGDVAYNVGVRRPNGPNAMTEMVERGTTGRITAGFEFGSPIGGKASIAGAKVGAHVGGQVGVYAEFLDRFGYEFDPTTNDANLAALRLYCMYADVPGLQNLPQMQPVITAAREIINPLWVDDLWRWSEVGAEFGGYGSLEGTLGVVGGKSLAVGGIAELGGECGVRTLGRYAPLEDRWEIGVGFATSASGNYGLGFGFGPNPGTGDEAAFKSIKDHLQLIGRKGTAWLGVEQMFTLSMPDGASHPDSVKLTTQVGGSTSLLGRLADIAGGAASGEDSILGEIEIEQPVASADEWTEVASIQGFAELLYGTGAPVVNAAFGDSLAAGLFGDNSDRQDLKYAISAELSDRDTHEFDLQGVLGLGAGIELELDFEKARRFPLEAGKIRSGRVYPLQSMEGSPGIPTNDISIVDIQKGWAIDALSFLDDAWNRFITVITGLRSDTVIYASTTTGDATLRIPGGVLPVGTTLTIDSWDAGDVNSSGLVYGVGGLYRFEADAPLQGIVALSLTYNESQVAFIDEAELQIYRHDAVVGAWDLVPANLDVNSNAVIADISTLGLYAIAPALPTGDLQFQLSASSAPADGATVTTAQAGNLRLNNGSVAADGWRYTVTATGMEIALGGFGSHACRRSGCMQQRHDRCRVYFS